MTRNRIVTICFLVAIAFAGILALLLWDVRYLLVSLGFLAALLEFALSRHEDSQMLCHRALCRRPDDCLLN